MTEQESAIAYAIWQAQAANSIGRANVEKRAKRAGMLSAASHIANALYPAQARQEERQAFIKACGFSESI